MEAEGSLPPLQEPSTVPYPEPYQSSSYHPILSFLRSTLILSTHLRLGLPSGPFPSGFHTNILYTFLFSPFVLHANLMLLDLVILIILAEELKL
jgi:hypothetical protein